MKFYSNKILALLLLGVGLFAVSCFKDLDTVPIDDDAATSANVYQNPAAYKQVLAKLYAGLSVSGQNGPHGTRPNDNDISGIDEGFSPYLRQYWKAQELPTDEAVISWNDGTIQDFHQQDWTSNSEFIRAMYYRIYFQVAQCNEFLRETTDAKLDERGVSGTLRTEIGQYRAEARFLRALSYWHALDMFRNVPFVTEDNFVGSFFPEQISKDNLFAFLETELKAIETQLVPARQNEYGRADQGAAWMLLAKLYLNGEVYTGRKYYTECLTYCNKVIAAGYTPDSEYRELFLADNQNADGVIFPIEFDGTNTRTWGGMTFIIHAAVGGNMNPAEFGIDAGWGGTRVTSALVNKFPAIGGSIVVAPNPGSDYPVIYAPGSYQGWDPSNTTTVLASKGANQYEGYLYFADPGTQFKFTLGPNWDNNFGDTGADGTLDINGDNIVAADAGFYKVNVDLTALAYTIQKTDWGLIGSATPDGWNSDQNLTYNAADGTWEITLALTAGEIKFRANDDWGLNYGDDGADALLEQNGANIAIATAGTYKIKLYLDHPDYTYSIERPEVDYRAMFHTSGQSLEINDIGQFTEGYAVTKFRNVTSTGAAGSNPTWVDTDFPMFRIEDALLMYAEAVLRGGAGGDAGTALTYVNQVRSRAYKNVGGTIGANDLTLDFLLDERAREFYWECQRRTDLVRFGQFTDGTYLWPWKGGVKDGVTRPDCYNVYPIPSSDLNANPNLVQNSTCY